MLAKRFLNRYIPSRTFLSKIPPFLSNKFFLSRIFAFGIVGSGGIRITLGGWLVEWAKQMVLYSQGEFSYEIMKKKAKSFFDRMAKGLNFSCLF